MPRAKRVRARVSNPCVSNPRVSNPRVGETDAFPTTPSTGTGGTGKKPRVASDFLPKEITTLDELKYLRDIGFKHFGTDSKTKGYLLAKEGENQLIHVPQGSEAFCHTHGKMQPEENTDRGAIDPYYQCAKILWGDGW